MTPLTIVKDLDIFLDRRLGMSTRFVMLMMGQFVLQAAPEAFHRRVIAPTASAIHADGNAILLEQLGKFLARELDFRGPSDESAP
jgi:hypothetical protein